MRSIFYKVNGGDQLWTGEELGKDMGYCDIGLQGAVFIRLGEPVPAPNGTYAVVRVTEAPETLGQGSQVYEYCESARLNVRGLLDELPAMDEVDCILIWNRTHDGLCPLDTVLVELLFQDGSALPASDIGSVMATLDQAYRRLPPSFRLKMSFYVGENENMEAAPSCLIYAEVDDA